MSLLLAILAIGLLIVIHELGHFGVARALGMKVEIFSVGFGPVLLSFRGKGETEYRFSLIPLGGYVQIAGMAPGDGTPDEEPRAFAKRPLWQRFLVIFAGPLTNWLFAVLVVGIIGAVVVVSAGAGDPLSPSYDDRPDVVVPADRPLRAEDLRAVRFTSVVRGYRASEVDALLDRLAREMELEARGPGTESAPAEEE